jgi:hypothetical protein
MLRLFSLLLASLLLLGCGSGKPFTDNSQDAELYAQDVKQIAYGAIAKARRSREPADQIRTLVREIEQQGPNRRPVGPHRPTYEALLAAAKPLMEECEKAAGGKAANLASRLDSLQKIAEKLPGKVQLSKE